MRRRADRPHGRRLAFILAAFPARIAVALAVGVDPSLSSCVGLIVFGVVFALNSAVHSFLILHYAEGDKVAMNVGFYYMANACGRLAGTVLSGRSTSGRASSLPVGVGRLRARRGRARLLLPREGGSRSPLRG